MRVTEIDAREQAGRALIKKDGGVYMKLPSGKVTIATNFEWLHELLAQGAVMSDKASFFAAGKEFLRCRA